MREAETDEFYGNLGYRKTTPDKLTWKNEIQKRLDICIATYKTNMFGDNVDRLIKTIIFDIKGYKFKIVIEEEQIKLAAIAKKNIDICQKEEPEIFGHPILQAHKRYELNEKYYNDLYDFLFQLIADKGLLLDTDVYIPIRAKKPMSVEDYGDIT